MGFNSTEQVFIVSLDVLSCLSLSYSAILHMHSYNISCKSGKVTTPIFH